MRASPAALWPLVSNTDRFNRDCGYPSVKQLAPPTDAAARITNARRLRAAVMGIAIEWEEQAFEWTEPFRYSVERRYFCGPLARMVMSCELQPRADGGTTLVYMMQLTPATATAHLHKLLADTLVVSVAQGRHKYFRFASPAVAHAIESLLAIAQPAAALPAARLSGLHRARFCYDHLAGRVATQLLASLVAQKRLRVSDREFTVTTSGRRWFAAIGIETDKVANSRRRFACACLDWSERRDHLGGALGAALAEQCVASGWVRRQAESRVATITPRGRTALQEHFGIAPE